jgi:hypothetical protein
LYWDPTGLQAEEEIEEAFEPNRKTEDIAPGEAYPGEFAENYLKERERDWERQRSREPLEQDLKGWGVPYRGRPNINAAGIGPEPGFEPPERGPEKIEQYGPVAPNTSTFTRDAAGRVRRMDVYLRGPIAPGTRADRNIEPPGFQGGSANQSRGHLRGKQLGGSGTDPDNLITITQTPTNNSHMLREENAVRRAVESGEDVMYSVILEYDGSNPVPSGIRMEAQGSRGFSIGMSIPNPAANQ